MLKHIVLLQWKDGTDAAAIERFGAGLAALSASIEEIRSYQFGPDAQLQENRYDYVLVAEFDDVESYQRYVVHPEHQAFLARDAAPILASYTANQFFC